MGTVSKSTKKSKSVGKISRAKGSHQELTLAVLKQFRLIFGSAKQHFRQIEESCGISGSQLWLLHEIFRSQESGVSGVSELAIRLAIHQSTCSQLVDKLERAGLLFKSRSREDQRRVGLKLTPSARKLLKNAPGPAAGILAEALQAMPDAALKNLTANLSELIGQLPRHDDRFYTKPLAEL